MPEDLVVAAPRILPDAAVMNAVLLLALGRDSQ
jgi:hypothetical protein